MSINTLRTAKINGQKVNVYFTGSLITLWIYLMVKVKKYILNINQLDMMLIYYINSSSLIRWYYERKTCKINFIHSS